MRALTRRPEEAALPADAEIAVGDLTAPASLDAALEGAGAVFLAWTAACDSAWRATLGHPAFVTSTVEQIVGSPPRTFSQWAVDHASAFALSEPAHDVPAG